MKKEEYLMRKVINLAKLGRGYVSPNPLVGAMVIKDDMIISTGYHQKFGGAHAEIIALNRASTRTTGATLVVNLEPCNHFGKTTPCTLKIIESGIVRVICGIEDPNPLVSGKGFNELTQAGIKVEKGILKDSCSKLNEFFIKFITTKKPFVTIKSALSIDGKVCTLTGNSKWISNDAARKITHKLRKSYDAIMVGVSTVINDDPLLTCRLIKNPRNPARIIVDSTLRIPISSNILKTVDATKAPTIIATTPFASQDKIKYLEDLGVKVVVTKHTREKKVDLDDLMIQCGKMEITSILIEGGHTLNTSALEVGIVNKLILFMSPIIIGGLTTPSFISGKGISFLNDAYKIEKLSVKKVNNNYMFEGYL